MCARGSDRALMVGPSASPLEPVSRAGFTAIATLALAGCGRPPAYDQHIGGTLTRAGNPASSQHVRFISSEAQGMCASPNGETVTDDQGHFGFTLRYEPSWFEAIDVVIHPFRLCVLEGSDWRSVWEFTSGPAPERLEFRCNLDALARPPCDVSWNGQAR